MATVKLALRNDCWLLCSGPSEHLRRADQVHESVSAYCVLCAACCVQLPRPSAAGVNFLSPVYSVRMLCFHCPWAPSAQVGFKERKRWCSDNFISERAMRRASDIHSQLAALLPQLTAARRPAAAPSTSPDVASPATAEGGVFTTGRAPAAAGSTALGDGSGSGEGRAGAFGSGAAAGADALKRQAADASDTTALRRALTSGLAMHGATLQLDGPPAAAPAVPPLCSLLCAFGRTRKRRRCNPVPESDDTSM